MIIDCIADLHGHYPELEGGDLLIVAGDLTARDDNDGWTDFELWFCLQKYRKKILIAGNHDGKLEDRSWKLGLDSASEYLCDSGTEFEYWEDLTQDKDPEVWLNSIHKDRKKKLKIWGSPWTLTFPGINPKCTAFTGDEEELAEKWKLIPDDVDILVTHGPPQQVRDWIRDYKMVKMRAAGSYSLKQQYKRIKPRLHIFGHIHEGYGKDGNSSTIFINCSHVNERYEPVNKPVRIIL